MKYVVLTSKHHEGFCLWDSAYTDYKVTNTPYGKDLLHPYVDAFRAAGLRVGFYYSLIDWHHPEFPIDGIHPLRNHPDARRSTRVATSRSTPSTCTTRSRELLTDFGEISSCGATSLTPARLPGLPGKGHEDWQSEKLLEMIRELQPGIILNNRLDLPSWPTSTRRSSVSRPSGSRSTASRWSGRRARPSAAVGDITGTRRPGNRRAS